jgi:gamma-glutamyltranspeptidase / glutathione hydrolase
VLPAYRRVIARLVAGLVTLYGAPAVAQQPQEFPHGIVVAADSLAASVGRDILRAGGNAVDAAAAVGFALAVTYPEAGNLGGGGYMIIHTADGKNIAVDFRETAPAAATATMFLDSAGYPDKERSLYGPLAAGVPGSVAGLLDAQAKFGVLNPRLVVAPAARIAAEGFPIDRRFASALAEMSEHLALFPSTRRIFYRGDRPLRQGDTLRQPELAAVLREISYHGSRGFYSGWVADLIVRSSQAFGGIISLDDLAGYRAQVRTPLMGSYRGYQIVTIPPSSAGGTILLEVLNQIERFDLSRYGAADQRAMHIVSSAFQHAFEDRAEYLGDPDFVHVPVERLIAKDFPLPRWKNWDSTRHMPVPEGVPAGPGQEGRNTTHFVVADAHGNVVSTTTTVNNLFGCGMVVDGAGFFLNDEMDDFSVKPGSRNLFGLVGSTANAIAPGKRMLSSMTPTIVMEKGRPLMALGARGGSRIPTTVVQIISNVIDHGMTLGSAVDQPRYHTQGVPDTLEVEVDGATPELLRALEQMSYRTVQVRAVASAQAMMVVGQGRKFIGVPDRREGGVALGY